MSQGAASQDASQGPSLASDDSSQYCPYCGKVIRHRSNLRKHIADMHSGIYYQFRCIVCAKVFRTKNSMLTHTYRQHPGIKVKGNNHASTPTAAATIYHHTPTTSNRRLNIGFVVCSFCKKTFSCISSLRTHIRDIHDNSGPYWCPHCNKPSKSQSGLRMHIQRHHRRPPPSSNVSEHLQSVVPQCPQCGKVFSCVSNVRVHIRDVHGTDGPYICHLCNKLSKSAGPAPIWAYFIVHTVAKRTRPLVICGCTLKTHISTMGPSHAPCAIKCQEPGLGFFPLVRERRQIRYECSVCGRTFSNVYNLKVHMRDQHLGLGSAKCEICGLSFKNLSTLRVHKSSVGSTIPLAPLIHGGDRDGCGDNSGLDCVGSWQPRIAAASTCWPRPHGSKFACELCGKEFTRRYSVKVHQRDSHFTRPDAVFKCRECGRTATTQKALKMHVHRYHRSYEWLSGDLRESRPRYPCELCGKGFTRRYNLKVHQQDVHFNPIQMAFYCTLCGKQTTSKNGLRQHLLKYHPKH
ncbi:Zinc finger protein 234-like 1, partial [Homarus americanus]